MNDNYTCLGEIFKAICLMQNNKCNEDCLEINKCNTRPIIIYNCQGVPWMVNINNYENNQKSSVFRIEKVNENCITLRVLDKHQNSNQFFATKIFIILDIKFICGISCLEDTYVECL